MDLTEWGGAGVGNWAHYPPTKTLDEQPTAQVPTHHYKTCAIQFLSFKLIWIILPEVRGKKKLLKLIVI